MIFLQFGGVLLFAPQEQMLYLAHLLQQMIFTEASRGASMKEGEINPVEEKKCNLLLLPPTQGLSRDHRKYTIPIKHLTRSKCQFIQRLPITRSLS